jgi:putative copper resistance protein D
VAAPILLALHAAAWVINASADHRLAADSLSNAIGRMELWRLGLAVGASWALLLLRREGLALLFASAALLVSGASGHAAAVEPLWATPAKALHLASAAAWFGGLLWLLVRYRAANAVFVRDAARVSSVALPAALIVTLTGVLQTILFTPSLRDLVRSSYGAVVAAKVAGLLVLLAFGAHHRYRVLPRLGRDASSAASFATSLRGEALIMVLVFLAGGLLAYIPTPRP